jgi:hypothetical protein
MAPFRDRTFLDDGLSSTLSDPADEVPVFNLPLVKVFMTLVAAIHDSGLP